MAKKETTSNLPAKLTQADVPSLLSQVNEKIAQLKGVSDEGNRTSGKLEGFGNIRDIKDQSTLIKAYSSVLGRTKAYAEAAKEFEGMGEVPAFKIDGSTADQWLHDIKLQYNQVTYKDQLEKLNAVKSELEKHLSAEDKLAASLGNIRDILGI